MNGKTPTKELKKWRLWLAEQGCWECGAPAQLHHAVGDSAKKRVGLERVQVGRWWLLPLCEYHHKEPDGIHGSLPHEHGITRKVYEKIAFFKLAYRYGRVPDLVIEAVDEWL